MGAHIPVEIGDVSAAWLKSELGWDVDSMDVQQIGAGIGVSSALYRLKLHGANCPSSVVVKLPALDEAAVFTSTMLRMYIREANFLVRCVTRCLLACRWRIWRVLMRQRANLWW